MVSRRDPSRREGGDQVWFSGPGPTFATKEATDLIQGYYTGYYSDADPSSVSQTQPPRLQQTKTSF